MRDGADEPLCWYPLGEGTYLRPDAYTVLRTAMHGDCWWLEIDQDTESVPRLRAKVRAYADHLTSGGVGPDKVPPRVLFTAPNQARADTIADLISAEELSAPLTVRTHDHAARFILAELTNP